MFPLFDLLDRNRDLLGDRPAFYGLTEGADVRTAHAAWNAAAVSVDSLDAHVAGLSEHAPWPSAAAAATSLVLVLPKGRARLELLAAAASCVVPAGTQLVAVGENRLGAKSAGATLGRHWDGVSKADAARHCSVLVGNARGGRFDPAPWTFGFDVTFRGRVHPITALAGAFSSDGLDPATAMLLDVLESVDVGGRVLDLGCGAGVLAAALAPHCEEVVAADASAAALWSSRRTLAQHANARVVASDGYAGVDGTFDHIVTNPPFHDGAAVDLDAALGFISGAQRSLRPGGTLHLVANRFLRYLDPLRDCFVQVDVVAQDGRFAVYRARRPRPA